LNWTEIDTPPPPLPCAIGYRELTAREKAGFLPAFRDQVRLGEALEQALDLKGLDHRAEVVLLAEQKQIQEVTEGEFARVLVGSVPNLLFAGFV